MFGGSRSKTIQLRLKCIVELQYSAVPEHYGTNDPEEMARIGLEGFKNDPKLVADLMLSDDSRVRLGHVITSEARPGAPLD